VVAVFHWQLTAAISGGKGKKGLAVHMREGEKVSNKDRGSQGTIGFRTSSPRSALFGGWQRDGKKKEEKESFGRGEK